jgi:uncharacterized protein (DUF58 family)
MITSRAILFGFIGGCFYLIAIVNSLPPLFFALMWLTAGILVSCFGIALLSLYGLRALWRLEASGVAQTSWGLRRVRTDDGDEPIADSAVSGRPEEESAGVGIALEIGNGGTFNKGNIIIEVQLRALRSELLEAAPGARPSRARWPRRTRPERLLVRRFLLEALPSRARLLTFLPLYDLERGRYTVEQVQAVGSDVLGLFRPRKRLSPAASSITTASIDAPPQDAGEAEQVIVGPRIVRLGRGGGAAAIASGVRGSGTAALSGRSDEFGGTRPYVAGDDLRFVHWKSTARRGEMVVREWERAALRRSLVLWDGAAFAWPDALSPGGTGNARSVASSTWGARLASGRSDQGRANAEPGSEMEQAWTRGVEWSLELALSLASALAARGEPCSLWRLDSTPQHAQITGPASLPRGAELLADALAQRTKPLPETLRGALASQGRDARASDSRAFLIALSPSSSLLASARHLRGATIVLIDISRLQAPRLQRAQLAAWRKSLRDAETQMKDAGLRVLRLPLASDEAAPGQAAQGGAPTEPDWDEWTREALCALLDASPGRASRSRATPEAVRSS